jgi:hypothetical protein
MGAMGIVKIAQLLRVEGWCVNHKKIERLGVKRVFSSQKAQEAQAALSQG